MQEFYPKEIYVDASVRDLPVTKRILAKYPTLPIIEVADKREIKYPQEHTNAKKQLYLAEFKGEAIKSCQGMGDYVCCQYYTISLVSDCHLECTYCILQDYLKNNPVITMYTNTDVIFSQITEKVRKNSEHKIRVGTGELSDSLALDHITEFSRDVVEFTKENPNVIFELKTKTANVGNLLNLDHNGNVVIAWSVNPETYIAKEEHKCDTLTDRLKAARACADKGYPVAFHFDPLLMFEDWQARYTEVIDEIAKNFKEKEIAWISLGSLRFTPGLKKISQERFPKSTIMSAEIFPTPDGKMRYFRPLREEMYRHLTQRIQEKLHHVPHYLCMETKAVWQNVFGDRPKNNSHLEHYLSQNFRDENTSPVAWDV